VSVITFIHGTTGSVATELGTGVSLLRKYLLLFLHSFAKTSLILYLKDEGKAVPLQARSGPEGSRKLRFPDFMTTTQDGGRVVSLRHRPSLSPENASGINFCLEAESIPGP